MILLALLSACSNSSEPTIQLDQGLVAEPVVLQGIDRVSLLAWKETLGSKYPFTVARADSIAIVLDFFKTWAGWREQGELTQIPMFAGFYRGQSLESERGFLEISHGQGGLLLIRERGKLYSRQASAADIDRFLSFFGVGVVIVAN